MIFLKHTAWKSRYLFIQQVEKESHASVTYASNHMLVGVRAIYNSNRSKPSFFSTQLDILSCAKHSLFFSPDQTMTRR